MLVSSTFSRGDGKYACCSHYPGRGVSTEARTNLDTVRCTSRCTRPWSVVKHSDEGGDRGVL